MHSLKDLTWTVYKKRHCLGKISLWSKTALCAGSRGRCVHSMIGPLWLSIQQPYKVWTLSDIILIFKKRGHLSLICAASAATKFLFFKNKSKRAFETKSLISSFWRPVPLNKYMAWCWSLHKLAFLGWRQNGHFIIMHMYMKAKVYDHFNHTTHLSWISQKCIIYR